MGRKKSATAREWIDPDDAPELTEEWFDTADYDEGDQLVRRGRPKSDAPKEALSLRLDPDVIAHDRGDGAGLAVANQRNLAQSRETGARLAGIGRLFPRNAHRTGMLL